MRWTGHRWAAVSTTYVAAVGRVQLVDLVSRGAVSDTCDVECLGRGPTCLCRLLEDRPGVNITSAAAETAAYLVMVITIITTSTTPILLLLLILLPIYYILLLLLKRYTFGPCTTTTTTTRSFVLMIIVIRCWLRWMGSQQLSGWLRRKNKEARKNNTNNELNYYRTEFARSLVRTHTNTPARRRNSFLTVGIETDSGIDP